MRDNRVLALIFLIGVWLYLVFGLAGRLYAQERCQPVDPATLVWTGYGFSVAMGDGHVFVTRDDVKYAEVTQPHLCMPDSGLLQLWLPHAWPSYARKPENHVHLAHGIYAWINDHNYKAADGTHCCGWLDCREIDLKDVSQGPGGMMMTPFGAVSPKGTYQSRDGKTWVCRRHFPSGTALNSCLFVPGGG